MYRKSILLAIFLVFSIISAASAADVLRHLSIENAMQSGKVKDALLPDVALYFAGDKHPTIIKDFGKFKASKRTNTFMKDKVESCEWAFASALITLQQSAVNHNGNAVINITSNVKNRENPSNIQFDCLVGGMMVNAALHGKVVELAK